MYWDCRTDRAGVYTFLLHLEFSNGCITSNIGRINTKLQDFANIVFLFLILWVSYCLSHTKRTRAQPSSV